MRIRLILNLSLSLIMVLGSGGRGQDRSCVEMTGRLYNFWYYTGDVEISGGLAYAATGLTGLQILDISNPQEPRLVGYNDEASIYQVSLYNNYIFGLEGSGGIHIFNVLDPRHPYKVCSFDTPGGGYSFVRKDELLYVADYNFGLRIIDISHPEHPVEIGACESDWAAWDVYVTDDYAFIAAGSLIILDISDPEHPTEIGNVETACQKITVAGDYAYCSYPAG